jgi:hypothetical protein
MVHSRLPVAGEGTSPLLCLFRGTLKESGTSPTDLLAVIEYAHTTCLCRTQCLLAGGALLLCEMLLDESGTSPPEVLLQSLNMLTQTHGRERKLSEYSHLLETAGFRRIEGRKTGSYLDAVIAFKDAAEPQAP